MKPARTCLLSLGLAATAAAQLPAFPGAMGFGAHATGGRGGDVYHVTNLKGSGEGSLRHGVETAPDKGRTIVFETSGYIPMPGKNLRLVKNKITIAGQTAPGDGIGFRDGTVRVTGNNTVIRHVRIRHGKGGGGGDCLNVDSSATDSIVDHITMQFSTDENISFFKSALDRFTMQSSVSAWGLERHNAGGLWDLNRGSCIGSLWAHHHTRNPKARPNGVLEWVNNVTFDWGIGFIMGDSETPASWKANVMGCYFLAPEGRTDGTALEKASIDRNGLPNFSIYLSDCLHDSDGDGRLNGKDKGYDIVAGEEYRKSERAKPGANRYFKADEPFTSSPSLVVDDPLTAFKKVVSDAGAVRLDASYAGPLRDEVDTVLIDNLVNQKTSRIASENELAGAPHKVTNKGFGTLESAPAPEDGDRDGMPDFWESALGMDAGSASHNDPARGDTFFPAGTPDGYTCLEEYLHFRAVPHAVMEKSVGGRFSIVTIDLRKFTAGFAKSPEFEVTDVAGGVIAQFAEDGKTRSSTGPIVKFSPPVGASGRAGFDFTVTDADRSRWTRQFGILVRR